MPKFDNSKPQLFIHPACSCGDVVDLVKKLSKEIQKFDYKEISLQHSEGRSRAFKVGVKIIPSLWFPDGTILVGSAEITKDNILKKI